jgi:N-lysine methyltransferase SETD6
MQEELRDYYQQVAEPLIHRYSNELTSQHQIVPTLHGFYRAYSLVSSRAFVVDAYHGLCMVPVADL